LAEARKHKDINLDLTAHFSTIDNITKLAKESDSPQSPLREDYKAFYLRISKENRIDIVNELKQFLLNSLDQLELEQSANASKKAK
jgi:hypothetical protein